ncbi:hypothetical protein DN069_11120 [Streptacidiphilus pinicola]|uniref:Uncharacterized protein n=1 Tax=Streptacidiphilus pinicola TaxID=2219663 RepID=A0A2X0IQL5_9ACTN|nr:hypothetical protein DN069_11120 [Streptacidiphilus pinicola]
MNDALQRAAHPGLVPRGSGAPARDRELDIEHGELTPSLKIKRPVVERAYAEVIEAVHRGAREAWKRSAELRRPGGVS